MRQKKRHRDPDQAKPGGQVNEPKRQMQNTDVLLFPLFMYFRSFPFIPFHSA